MIDLLKSLFRHFRLSDLLALMGGSLAAAVPLALAFSLPLVAPRGSVWGLVFLVGGLGVTGVVLATVGRVLDRRFQGQKPAKGAVLRGLKAGWAEGLVVGLILLALFQLGFSSVPFYWSQGTVFGWLSLGTLVVGTLLFLGALGYYLPVRRREGLGLMASFGRSFQLLNTNAGLSLKGFLLSVPMVAASVAVLGLFPGFGGLAAFHQALYDRAVGPRSSRD